MKNTLVSPPILVEVHLKDRVAWLLSFGGPNPEPEDSIELSYEQASWLYDKIMNIDPNLYARAKDLYLNSR